MADSAATPNKASEMIQYQADAVVSRVIIKKKTGNVTLFAFDAGQELTEHTSPFDALAHVLDGEAEISISGAPNRLSAGDMIMLTAGHPHAVKAVKKFKMLLTMIKE